jgi:hypothetical protein
MRCFCLLLLVGCSVPGPVDLSRATGRPVTVEYGDSDGWETKDRAVIVRLERGWAWEPDYYRMGAVACLAADACDLPRNVVMDRIGIPQRFQYGAPGDTKRDATRMQARIERYLGQTSAPGWPTFAEK